MDAATRNVRRTIDEDDMSEPVADDVMRMSANDDDQASKTRTIVDPCRYSWCIECTVAAPAVCVECRCSTGVLCKEVRTHHATSP